QDEAPRLDADDAVDGDVVEAAHEVVDGAPEGCWIAEQWRDVAEGDAWTRVVSDISNVLANPTRIGCHESRLPSNPSILAMPGRRAVSDEFSCAGAAGATGASWLAR